MSAGAKLYAAKCLGLLGFAGVVWLLQSTFLDEPIPYAVPSILLAGGLYLGFFDPTSLVSPHARGIKQAVGIFLALTSLWLARPAPPEAQLPWEPYSEKAVGQAGKLRRPVMVDFFATWCEPCLELDRRVFDRRVVVEAAGRFINLRADISDQNSAASQSVLARYHLEAFPTVVFIGSDGRERLDLRLTGVESATSFMQRMAECK